VRCACIDVGSNTTRLLVADADAAGTHDVLNERVFTLIGRSLDDGGAIPPEKIGETARVVAEQAARARELGAEHVRAVATAAIRRAGNAGDLVRAVAERAEIELEVLTGEEEARLAFRGAARAVGGSGALAVVDVGGGSTEIATGDASGAIADARSIPVGSSLLADRHFHSDPPSAAELAAVRADVAAALDGFAPPAVERVVAVGGSAGSLQHLTGGRLGRAEFESALALLAAEPSDAVAARFGLDPVRVRLLPAGLLVLAALGERMRQPLRLCRGGLREGVILEMTGHAQ
jgi:exopolyphosphatase/guanosine-5'-triphosphate,3'-diphosphate pyrophosphatase